MFLPENYFRIFIALIDLNIEENLHSASIKINYIEENSVLPENLLTEQHIKMYLAAQGVEFGYISENIQQLISDFTKNIDCGRYYKIAEYKAPLKGADANIIWYFGPLAQNKLSAGVN